MSSPLRAHNETALPLNSKDNLMLIEQHISGDESSYNSLQVHMNKMQEEGKQGVMDDFARLESFNAAAFDTQKKDINDIWAE